ncbi:hypothetical protein A4H97_12365 [Niastella yeongjuensis]|uniref:Iron dicitrate transport regulator FecR n=2 Tax=Niastella yeongjuensis TaxID=354355 RepID=A0A1V9EA16_9BACT|nr:hypothetical protein A4H97_12365 [Niastella yeongjuensis]SEO60247.1 FecR family protein [Niastella yeongjuensis]
MAALIHKMREKQPLLPAEQQELADWLNSNESNTQLLETLQNRENLTAELEALMQYDEDNAVAAIFSALGEPLPAVAPKATIKMGSFLAAASLLVLIGLASWFYLLKTGSTKNGGPSIVYKTISTAPGEQHRVLLADGSEVWLSAASSIRYPASFKGDTREVAITGEAYFSVTKDKTKPFLVTANNAQVQVVGTKFDVMAYSDEDATRVTLLEGSVRVGRRQRAEGREEETVVLKPGEQVSVSRSSGLSQPIPVQTDEVTAWREGQFRFNETDIPSIMRQIARWYKVKIEYNGAVDDIHFSGQISRKEHINELLDILSDTRKVHFEMTNDSTIVVIPGHK